MRLTLHSSLNAMEAELKGGNRENYQDVADQVAARLSFAGSCCELDDIAWNALGDSEDYSIALCAGLSQSSLSADILEPLRTAALAQLLEVKHLLLNRQKSDGGAAPSNRKVGSPAG